MSAILSVPGAAGLMGKRLGWTIDALRRSPELLSQLAEAEIVVIIAGTTVPGSTGRHAYFPEGNPELAAQLQKPRVILSGPIIHCNLDFGDVDYIAREIPAWWPITSLPVRT